MFYCTEQANKKISEIKSEAYKEFAGIIKNKWFDRGIHSLIRLLDDTRKEDEGNER